MYKGIKWIILADFNHLFRNFEVFIILLPDFSLLTTNNLMDLP